MKPMLYASAYSIRSLPTCGCSSIWRAANHPQNHLDAMRCSRARPHLQRTRDPPQKIVEEWKNEVSKRSTTIRHIAFIDTINEVSVFKDTDAKA
jgi:hypothetical protein